MVRSPKTAGMGLLVLLAAFLGWKVLWPPSDPVARAVLRLDAGSEVPAIGLARLGQYEAAARPPERDVFEFGRDSRADRDPVPNPVIALPPLAAPDAGNAPGSPSPTPWPLLDLSLIGIVDNGEGRTVGSFVKDGEILLVGEAGQVLGNAFRVVRVGSESAEIEELGSGRTRRLPLRTR